MKLKKILFFAGIIIIFLSFLLFYNEIRDIFSGFISIYGLFGMFIFVVILDTIIQPFSPDLLIFGSTLAGSNLYITALVGGVGSVIAGVLGYLIGRKIGATGFKKWFGQEHLEKGQSLFDKYGIWAIVVGALSPIPYSSACWTAGIYKMKFTPFLLSSIFTRIPRFFIMAYIGYSL